MSLPDWIRNTETDLPDVPGFPTEFENANGGVAYIGRSDYNLRGEIT